MDEGIITNVAEQIIDTGCTSGRQTTTDENGEEVEVAWELTINVLD